jgi:transcriptional regulator with XRE-family HTH domain
MPSGRNFQTVKSRRTRMPKELHWTEESVDAFAHNLAFNFIAQIERKLETTPLSQTELAHRLGVSEGAVSKVLNNPQNLTLKTIAKYARALQMKAAVVAYEDDDPRNEKGLISPEIFTTCWQRAGKPRDVWSLQATHPQQTGTTNIVFINLVLVSHGCRWFWGSNFVGSNSVEQRIVMQFSRDQLWQTKSTVDEVNLTLPQLAIAESGA